MTFLCIMLLLIIIKEFKLELCGLDLKTHYAIIIHIIFKLNKILKL